MYKEQSFLKKHYDTIFLLLTCLPGLIIVGASQVYFGALIETSKSICAFASFWIILLSAITVFNAFNFKIKKSLLSFIIMASVAVLMIVPIFIFATNIAIFEEGTAEGTINYITYWTSAKKLTLSIFIGCELMLLVGVFMAALKIDPNAKYKD